MPVARYSKDPDLNLHVRASFAGIGYSDGAEVEQRMLSAVEAAKDRSVFSRDLARAITDWPSEYHFSSWRHCLLRPLDIKPGARVLELGCGCGAITRYLGEIGADVTAVEGSPMRARIAATRCQDLNNVRVIAEDLTTLELEETFDVILLIGVLEYAPVFCGPPNPARHYLESLSRYLARKGRLVVAIENKLGLKYFNACGEDHLGVPFVGVQNLYGDATQRTWGRMELSALLNSSGFDNLVFLYPFPDYKLPRVILTEAGVADPQFAPEEILATIHARDYGHNQDRLFDEPLVSRELVRNGLISEMSNSFLVTATREAVPTINPDLLAVTYAAGRKAAFAIQTQILRKEGTIRVVKENLYPDLPHEASFSGFKLRQVVGESSYVAGPMAVWRLVKARAQHGGLDEIIQSLMPWFEFLLSQAQGSGDDLADYMIGGHSIDLTPLNLIETPDGLQPIDQEWMFDRPVPLGWVVSRCVAVLLADYPGFEDQPLPLVAVLARLCAERNLRFRGTSDDLWADLEYEYMDAVLDMKRRRKIGDLQSCRLVPLPKIVSEQAAALSSRDAGIAAQAAAFATHQKEIAALRQMLVEKDLEVADLKVSLLSREVQSVTLQQALDESLSQVRQLDAALVDHRSTIREQGNEIRALSTSLSALQIESETAKEFAENQYARFTSEIVALTRFLREKEDDAEWLRQVAATLVGDSRRGRLASLLPGPLASAARDAQLRRRNLFDAAAYFNANADVAEAGGNALRHYLIHGLGEGRRRR